MITINRIEWYVAVRNREGWAHKWKGYMIIQIIGYDKFTAGFTDETRLRTLRQYSVKWPITKNEDCANIHSFYILCSVANNYPS
jgi:hypothetical protein